MTPSPTVLESILQLGHPFDDAESLARAVSPAYDGHGMYLGEYAYTRSDIPGSLETEMVSGHTVTVVRVDATDANGFLQCRYFPVTPALRERLEALMPLMLLVDVREIAAVLLREAKLTLLTDHAD